MPDYSKGKIYRLVSNEMIYIGSTIGSLSERKYKHKSDFLQWKNGNRKNYITSFKLFELNQEVEIVLIEKYPCNDIEELHRRERYWIENSPNCVNKNKPSHTRSKDDILKWSREYQSTDARKKYAADYKEKNKTHIQEYMANYAQQNKDRLTKYYRERHERMRDEISARQKEKIKCECDREVNRSSMSKHKKTKIHLDYINKNK